ncbi:MAG: alpha-E domain-containing protein, partial [Pseudomonadota bacterium]|nr:alpha-E domain-containing protein [Pseudomonadota bacterium]
VFLILSFMCPRSFFYAVDKIQYHLGRLTHFYKSDNAAIRNVKIIHKGFVNSSAEQIIDFGLHEFLTKFIDDMSTTYSDLEEVYFLGTDR